MAKKRVVILGAGLAGLSAAYYLQKEGIECIIFEKEKEVGGLCRSKNIKGFTFDYSGHLLHFRERKVFNFVKELLGRNLVKHERNARIYSFERFSRYPFQANFYGLPDRIKKECLDGFIKARRGDKRKEQPSSFYDWIKQNFGEGIARHFMIPYNSKFWTVSPQELTCDWVDGFIPIPSISEITERASEDFKGNLGYNASFWYPIRGGINQLPLALASQIDNIFTNCEVIGIDPKRKEIRLKNGAEEHYDILLSTLPLPEFPRLVINLPREIISCFEKLKWNSIFNLNLGIKRKIDKPYHWIYFPEDKFCFFRIGIPSNFSLSVAHSGKSSVYAEVSYSINKPINKNKIVSKIIKDLIEAGIANSRKEICAQDVSDIKYGYPIYDINYNNSRGKILDFLNDKDIISFGRYGSWRYMSMEDAIIDGANAKSIFK